MRNVALTSDQQTQAATNKAAVTSARAAVTAANKALMAAAKTAEDYLRTAISAQASDSVSLSDDGTSVIVG